MPRRNIIGGFGVVLTFCIIGVILVLHDAGWTNTPTIFSICCSTTAFIAMSCSLLIATRLPFINSLFGGLDKAYSAHKKNGILIGFMILAHYSVTPNFRGVALSKSANELGKLCGTIAFYCFVVMIVVSLLKKTKFFPVEVPYNYWRQLHRLSGVLFLLASIHALIIKKPFPDSSWLGVYIVLVTFVGVISFVYTQFAPMYRRTKYIVTSLEHLPSATLVEAEAIGKPIRWRAGQFAFVSSNRRRLAEPHPFTIALDNNSRSIRFLIKSSGDFTSRLHSELRVGDLLRVDGGYGQFSYQTGNGYQVWLAGGIGITPFIAMAQNLDDKSDRRIHLIHCVRYHEDAYFKTLFEQKSNQLHNFSYSIYVSADNGRFNAEALMRSCPFELAISDLYYCGPVNLRIDICKELNTRNLRPKAIEYEIFQFR